MEHAQQAQAEAPETAISANRPSYETGDVDDLACNTKGLRRQAEVAEQNQARLEAFSTQFQTARGDYTQARDAARTAVDQAREQLETIRCQLNPHVDDRLNGRLEQALRAVVREIDACPGGRLGCCVEDTTFEDDAGGSYGSAQRPSEGTDEISRLAGLIARYQRDTAKAADCFDALIEEQTELPQRATTIKADLDALEAEVIADAQHVQVVRHWARVLVAQHRLDTVWQGFPSVRAYVDCLCTAFVVALRGWEAIARVEGQKATLECYDEARNDRCSRLKSDTVGEVLSEYERRWPPEEPDTGAGGYAERRPEGG